MMWRSTAKVVMMGIEKRRMIVMRLRKEGGGIVFDCRLLLRFGGELRIEVF